MIAVGITLLVLSLLGVGAFVAAVVACVRGRWRLALVIARTVALAAPAILLLALAAVVALAAGSSPALKAAKLSMGISEWMNGGVVLFLSALSSAVVWLFGSWRLRLARRRTG
jgi:hypothetical protein